MHQNSKNSRMIVKYRLFNALNGAPVVLNSKNDRYINAIDLDLDTYIRNFYEFTGILLDYGQAAHDLVSKMYFPGDGERQIFKVDILDIS